jgi:hypothetical protein
LAKAPSFITFTELGMTKDVKLEQAKKAQTLISSNAPKTVADAKPVQLSKARTPIFVTEAGVVIDCKLPQ